MCGRFTLRKSAEVMASYFKAAGVPTLAPRYNVAPAQLIPAVVQPTAGERLWEAYQWGLVPHWSKTPNVAFSNINARVETAAKAPAFRDAFRKRRCLIPADGFYDWSGTKGHKQATFFRLKDVAPFAFAGLYEHWERDGEILDTCAFLTRDANDVVKPIHARMPVLLLTGDDFAAWLGGAVLPQPTDPGRMEALAVGRYVNNARNEGLECLTPDPERTAG
jgi:putative SOS response-associated peptidase YedK